MGVLISAVPTATPLAGGAASAAGQGAHWTATFGGTWLAGDQAAISLVNALTNLPTLAGAGNVTGTAPVFALTFNNKLYALAGATAYFSDNGKPASFNDPNGAGNSFITLSNWYATAENLVAAAPYQGKLLFASRRNVQIWAVDPDPQNYQQTQVLPNIGTVAAQSMQAVGDADVYMLADNGFRSVRVRDASNNARVADVGAPIDLIVQPLLATLTDAQKAAACGVIEPASNRYWCYLPNADGSPGSIYVFSNFDGVVAAWSTYAPTHNTLGAAAASAEVNGVTHITGLTIGNLYYYAAGPDATGMTCGAFASAGAGSLASLSFTALATTADITHAPGALNTGTIKPITRTPFIPAKFAVHQGRVYVRALDGTLFIYGGTDNLTYENCGVQGDTPFINAQTPGTRKSWQGVDMASEGKWSLALGVSPGSPNTVKNIVAGIGQTFERALSLAALQSTHVKLRFSESGDGYARFSSALIHYQAGDDK